MARPSPPRLRWRVVLVAAMVLGGAACTPSAPPDGADAGASSVAEVVVPDQVRDGGTFRGTATRTGRTGSLAEAFDGGDPGVAWTIEGTDPVIASPVLDGDVALVPLGNGESGEVVAVDALDGTIRWRVDVADADASPVVVGDHVVVASRDGTLTTLWLDDGTVAWTVDLGDRVRSSPLLMGSDLVVGVGDELVAVAATDGSERWRTTLGGRIDGSATRIGDTIAVGDTANGLWLLDDDGEVVAETDLGEVVDGTFVPGIAGTPAVAGDLLVVGSTNATVVGLATDTLAAAWAVELDGGIYTSAAIDRDDETAFLATDAGTVVALDVADGTIAWEVEAGKAIYASPTLTDDDEPTLLVLEEGGNLLGLDPDDGAERWRTPVGEDGNYMSSTPVVTDETIVLGTNTGDLIGIR